MNDPGRPVPAIDVHAHLGGPAVWADAGLAERVTRPANRHPLAAIRGHNAMNLLHWEGKS